MTRQTSGRVAALTVAVCCLLGLLSGPHQALAQGSSSQSRSSSIADSTGAFPVSINNAYTNTQGFNAGANAVASGRAYNGFGEAAGTARSGSFSNFGATDTFTDTNGFSFNGASINNADAFCPGGSVSAGMAIYDTMQFVPCDVSTVCFGTAASMGAFLLGAGAPGKRRSLPNARIMIHQPLGGAQGQAADVEI